MTAWLAVNLQRCQQGAIDGCDLLDAPGIAPRPHQPTKRHSRNRFTINYKKTILRLSSRMESLA
ncbi:MAG: hypothetical protein ACRESJ_21665, partial [Pseudomonas sp.]|uniref:hypothetical protein n=1 Tax=Pseudomonas sp. TaxID=306 RepID=UPI003D6EA3DD